MAETLHTRFHECAERNGDRIALMAKKEGAYQPISWKVLERSVRYVALGLSSLGVKQGDRVALLSENRPEWAVSDLAILSEGAVTVPIYPTNTPKEIAHVLRDSEARVLLVSSADQLAKVRSLKEALPALETVVTLDSVEADDTPTLEDLWNTGRELATGEPGLYARHAARAAATDPATIIYTSGTTGDPKGVVLTHRNILFNCDAADSVVPVLEGDICLSFLPLSHVLERTVGQFFMLFHGVTIAYAEGIEQVAENMAEVRPTLMISVPRLFEKMYARVLDKVQQGPALRRKIFFRGIDIGRKLSPYRLRGERGPLPLRLAYGLADRLVFSKVKERLGGRLRYFVSGGAPLSREVAEFFYAAGVTIIEGYGLTESSPVISANRHDRIKFGTIGPPLPGIEVRIAEDGEILTRSPSVMAGYFRNEEATREVLDAEGWLHTGDVGVQDADGFITITDRKKDIIVTSGGKNVAPQNIENLLVTDPYIQQIMVYGDRRKYLTALVVPDFDRLTEYWMDQGIPFADSDGMAADPRVHDFLMERIREKSRDLARYEQLKEIAVLPQAFTQEEGLLTPTMKVRRKMVVQKYFHLLDALYEKEF